MSDPGPPREPAAPIAGRQILLVLLGYVLLLPGGCSLFVMAARWKEWDPREQIFQTIVSVWIATFVLAALGVALIVVGRRGRKLRP